MLKNDLDQLKARLVMKDKEQNLLTRQIRGLHEDNERMVQMYKMVQATPSKTTKTEEEVNGAPTLISEYAETRKKDRQAAAEQKGWKIVEDDFGGGSFGAGSPGSAFYRRNQEDNRTPSGNGAYQDPKETIIRH